MLSRSAFAILLVCASFVNVQDGEAQNLKPEGAAVSFKGQNVSPFRALLQVAEENQLPIGIVFGVNPLLCAEKENIEIPILDPTSALRTIVAGTGYQVLVDNGVYLVAAPDSTEEETRLLNFRFRRFAATDMTLNAAGAQLSGYIKSEAQGDSAFAFDNLFSLSAKRFNFRMEGVTTKEIANRIVSSGDKGLWLFRSIEKDQPRKAGHDDSVVIFGYKDDAPAINRIDCRGFVGNLTSSPNR